jgi:hypothetical protein
VCYGNKIDNIDIIPFKKLFEFVPDSQTHFIMSKHLAVHNWMDNLYKVINKCLMNNTDPESIKYNNIPISQFINTLKEKMVPFKNLKKNNRVYRGGTNVFGLEKSFSKPTFVSVSLEKKVALNFMDNEKKCCLYEYKMNDDVLVLDLSYYERFNEKEVLVHPDSYFEYINKTIDEDFTTYHYRIYNHLYKTSGLKYNHL